MLPICIILGLGFIGALVSYELFRKRNQTDGGQHPEETIVSRVHVTGKDEIEIYVAERPKHVFVEFEDEENWATCGPIGHDTFSWELDQNHQGMLLRIRWDVTGNRVIFYELKF